MWLFKNLKARILKSIITWSEMGKQTAQAKEVYCHSLRIVLTENCPVVSGTGKTVISHQQLTCQIFL